MKVVKGKSREPRECFMLEDGRHLLPKGIFFIKRIQGKCIEICINPLSPNGNQHQFSPNDIHTLSRDYVIRINEMIINPSTAKCSQRQMSTKFANFLL